MGLRRPLRCLLILLILSSTSCGFHPRDTPMLPKRLATMHVSTPSPYDNFTRKLKAALIRNGATLCNCPNHSATELLITNLKFSQDIPTISNSSTARVYYYSLALDYQLKSTRAGRNTPARSAVRHLIASRFVTLNAGILAETNNQVWLVHQSLIDDLVRQVLQGVRSTG